MPRSKPIQNSGINVGSESAPASHPIGLDAAGEVGQPEDLLVEHQDPAGCGLLQTGLHHELRLEDPVDDPGRREGELQGTEV